MACPVEVLASAFGSSDRDPLHNIPGDLLVAPVVEPGGARVGVAAKITEITGVKAAHPWWGLPDVIAQAEVENEAALENLVLGQIQAIEGVTETDTHVVLEG